MSILLDHVKRFEGLHKKGKDGLIYPYLCPAGVRTIGYGTTGFSKDTVSTTVEQAEAFLRRDLSRVTRQVLAASPLLSCQSESKVAAIVSFAYNCGFGAYKASTLKKRVDTGDWEGAAIQIRRWVYGGGKKLPGLVLRREAEARMLLA